MNIGLISDTHDQTQRVKSALSLLESYDLHCLIHLGDVCRVDMIPLFQRYSLHLVQGNNDWEEAQLKQAMELTGSAFHGEFGSLELAGKKLWFTHGHRFRKLQSVIESGSYDYVFHGHTHEWRDETIGATRVINPGAFTRVSAVTCAVLSLVSGELQPIVVPKS